jgi:hypothetical protein
MTILKTILKVVAAIGLIGGGLVLGGTALTAKKIDQAGDQLQNKIYH